MLLILDSHPGAHAGTVSDDDPDIDRLIHVYHNMLRAAGPRYEAYDGQGGSGFIICRHHFFPGRRWRSVASRLAAFVYAKSAREDYLRCVNFDQRNDLRSLKFSKSAAHLPSNRRLSLSTIMPQRLIIFHGLFKGHMSS